MSRANVLYFLAQRLSFEKITNLLEGSMPSCSQALIHCNAHLHSRSTALRVPPMRLKGERTVTTTLPLVHSTTISWGPNEMVSISRVEPANTMPVKIRTANTYFMGSPQ